MPDIVVPPVQRHTFSPGPKTGPISNHRDGGGPDMDFDDDGGEPAPF
jgi:hypothetical protein